MSDDQASFPSKWNKYIKDGTFKEEAESMDSEELRQKIVTWQQEVVEGERRMENDEKLNMLKEQVKDISDSYKEIINTHHAMVRYAVYVLEGRGQA